MRNDPMKPPVTAVHAGSERGSWEGEPLGLGWWVSGGASLLAWTGIALLLTSA